MNRPQTGCVPMYPRLGTGEPWETQYLESCGLPFVVYQFSAKGKNGYKQAQGVTWDVDLCPMWP